ncbi:MAG: tetratricopeptide repeat protein, partial [Pseudobdellovibrio sp.]
MKLLALILIFIIIFANPGQAAQAASENVKGLLPEVRLSETNEEQNQIKSFQSEVMITKTENKAIESLKVIIKKRAGAPEEADLLYRLAELYMRRSKSGRYFDLDQQSENKLNKIGLKNQKAGEALKQALQIYNQIINRFPKYHDLDYVYFNSALANAQLKNMELAKTHYLHLVKNFPESELVPDALLEVGEIFYQQQNFSTALEKFKDIEKFPDSKAYPYGLYKSAWCYYNLKNTDAGIKQLVLVVTQNPANSGDSKKFNLRKESLRDLTLFVGETLMPNQVLGFFKKIATEEELGDIIFGLTSLYESHSRYKEISIFADEFIQQYPQHAQTPRIFSKLVETYETLKNRDIVIKKLTQMAQYCEKQTENPGCKDEFKKVSLEISKKWWEIWLKNKTNVEFSQLTEQAFEILLSVDSEKSPDSTSRFAFAELLFQQNKLDRAAVQYETVSKQPVQDLTLKHDALYGALFSIEKQIEIKETDTLTEKQKELALRYLNEFKNGEHVNELAFKVGYIFYKQKQYDTSLTYLEPLNKKIKYSDLKTKCQDIILDIYNIKKDYVTLKDKATAFLKEATSSERKNSLTKISEEAHYTQIQLDAQKLKVPEQIGLFVSFANEHSGSPLGQSAFWRSISLAYSNGYDIRGAELSLDYRKTYPHDEKNLDALKDASKAFLEAGHIDQAISTTVILSEVDQKNKTQYAELKCDLTALQNQTLAAKSCYADLFNNSDKANKVEYLKKLMIFYPDKKSAEYKKLENQILSSNIEPYATQILIQQARTALDEKDYKQAFSMSLKINARPVDEDVRAEARLIQAEILENEFVSQSVKAREDKMAMVIAMKTEKLDKSFTAYSSAIKMSKNEKVQLAGLQGIDRLYAHFIDSLTNMPMPESLSADEQVALKKELAKIAEPFIQKRKNNADKLKEVSIGPASSEIKSDWVHTKIQDSIAPSAVQPGVELFKPFYLSQLQIDKNFERINNVTGRCEVSNISAASINSCLYEKKYEQAEKIALKVTENKDTRT